jgi:hypothetical protein
MAEIKIIIGIIVVIIWAFMQLAGKNKGPQQPMNQPARKPQPRPKAQQPAGTDLRKEIEAFLRQATGQGGAGQGGGQQAGQRQPQGGRAADAVRGQGKGRSGQGRREELPVEAEVVSEEQLEQRMARARVESEEKQRRRTREFQQRAEHLADDVEVADVKMREHLEEKFDHQVGRLTSNSQQKSAAAETAPEPAPTPVNLSNWLRRPANVRQALVVSEILQRPEHRW